MKIAIYPGSFDPITLGHLDILSRALKVFDKVIILVAYNPDKHSYFSPEERVEMIKEAVKEQSNVEVYANAGLTVRFAKEHHATHLIRGLRAVSDYEYEQQLASANKFLDPEIDTVFFVANDDKSFISSSSIMQMYKNGADVSRLVPESVIKRLK